MPEMDGYEVCRRLKSDERHCRVPVIFISAFGEVTKKIEGFDAGGVDFISKPFEAEEVMARVRTHLRLQELTDRLEQEVKERTTELARANERLRGEIEVRKRAEEDLRKSRDQLELRVQERTTELQNTNNELRKANEELRQIPSRLIAAQEEERKRLASELHDSIGQTLAALKFRTEFILNSLRKGEVEDGLKATEEFIPTLQRSIEETRAIYMGLRPKMLEDFGVIAALRWYREELILLCPERHIEIDMSIEEHEIPKSLHVPIFRIAQEALNNVTKHSGAEWADVSLSLNGNGIELVVSDDGIGMDVDLILQSSTARSLGLTGMKERAELSGGKFTIDSTPGEGTTVRVCWAV